MTPYGKEQMNIWHSTDWDRAGAINDYWASGITNDAGEIAAPSDRIYRERKSPSSPVAMNPQRCSIPTRGKGQVEGMLYGIRAQVAALGIKFHSPEARQLIGLATGMLRYGYSNLSLSHAGISGTPPAGFELPAFCADTAALLQAIRQYLVDGNGATLQSARPASAQPVAPDPAWNEGSFGPRRFVHGRWENVPVDVVIAEERVREQREAANWPSPT
jgi:hypothetical protein